MLRNYLKDFQKVSKELVCKYLDITIDEYEKRLKDTTKKAVDDWNKLGMEKFYKDTKVYLYGLTSYSNYDRLENIIFPLSKFKKVKLLDFGGGIASISVPLSEIHEVYYYDIPSETQDFARYLVRTLGKNVTFLEKENLWKEDYSIIVCVDVLEHLKNPMKYVKLFTRKLKRGHFFLTTGFNFSINKETPMHLPENEKYRKEYNDYMEKHYNLMYYMRGLKEVIFMYVKKEKNIKNKNVRKNK